VWVKPLFIHREKYKLVNVGRKLKQQQQQQQQQSSSNKTATTTAGQ
jgi:hypothetical protein